MPIRPASEWLYRQATRGDLCPVIGTGATMDLVGWCSAHGIVDCDLSAADYGWSGLVWRSVRRFLNADSDVVDDVRSQLDEWGLDEIFEYATQASPETEARLGDRFSEVLYEGVPKEWCEKVEARQTKVRGQGSIQTSAALEPAPYLLGELAVAMVNERHREASEPPFDLISFNFDLSLEEAIAYHGGRPVIVAMMRRGKGDEYAEFDLAERGVVNIRDSGLHRVSTLHPAPVVRILHPHGIVCRKDDEYDDCGLPLIPDLNHPYAVEDSRTSTIRNIVFSDQSYDSRYTVTLDARNRPLIAAFSSLKCCFYGWSFTDVSVRRILRIGMTLDAKNEDPSHLALMRKPDAAPSADLLRTDFSPTQTSAHLPFRDDEQRTFYVDALSARLENLGIVPVITQDYEHHKQIICRTLSLFRTWS